MTAVHDGQWGFGGPTACMAAGVSYRQLDYWARIGLVVPSPLSDADPRRRVGQTLRTNQALFTLADPPQPDLQASDLESRQPVSARRSKDCPNLAEGAAPLRLSRRFWEMRLRPE